MTKKGMSEKNPDIHRKLTNEKGNCRNQRGRFKLLDKYFRDNLLFVERK